MKFSIQNIHTTITDCTSKQKAYLDKTLSVPMPGYQFMPAYKLGRFDGMRHFFNKQANNFPTGFLPYILTHCQKNKWPVTFVDHRRGQYKGAETDYDEGLRDYQVDAVDAILCGDLPINDDLIPWHRGIIKAPTGSGKTPMAARLIQALNVPTLYLVESLDNMYQTQRVIEEWTGNKCGIMGDGKFQPEHITVCSLRTLISRKKELKSYFQSIQCLIVDECHLVSGGNYHTIMTSCSNAWARIGISATPLSRNDLGDAVLIGDTGEISYEVQRKILEDEGYLARCRVIFLPIKSPVDYGASYQTAYDELIVRNQYRNAKIIWATKKLLAKNRTIIILVKIVKHGDILRYLLSKESIKSYFVSGKDSTEIRKSLLEGVGQDFKVLVASTIFNQSIDCPVLDDLIVAAGGDSAINVIQRAGRVLRPKTHGENYATIVEFSDTTNSHLMRHAEHRFAVYKQEGFDVKALL